MNQKDSIATEDDAKVEDLWRRDAEMPRRYAYRVEEGGEVSHHGPFDSKETCAEYADNSDLNVTEIIEMRHPDDVIRAIHEKHKAFCKNEGGGHDRIL